ncbi:hypothetical protein [Streptosporangium sp. NPDC087985]|uniref:hypothetical protein n=1 Tax=Streptosporangium sp. NPDC087985 TaxID=3366196 RepID=UPI0037F251FE
MRDDEMNTPDKPLTAAQAESLTATSEPWLSCDDCFDHIDSCVDALIHDGRGLDEPMRVHLARCPACYEEAETLISLAAAGQGMSSGQGLNAFRIGLGLPVRAQTERRTGQSSV